MRRCYAVFSSSSEKSGKSVWKEGIWEATVEKAMPSKIEVKCPFAMQWKIPKYRLTLDEEICSEPLNIPGTEVTYIMSIILNNDDGTARRYINKNTSVYIAFEGGDYYGIEEYKGEFTISSESAAVSKTATHENQNENLFETWECELCGADELLDPKNRYVVDDELILTVEGFLMLTEDQELRTIKEFNDAEDFCINLWNQDNKDFTIIVDGKEIKAHKLILSARSPVFAAMFQPHTKEAQENRVVIPYFPFVVVEAAIKSCYFDGFMGDVSIDDQMLVLQFYDMHDIQSLKDILEQSMISKINAANVCRLANCALLSNAFKLQSKCAEFLVDCLKKTKAVLDLNILDTDFASNAFKNAFYQQSLTL